MSPRKKHRCLTVSNHTDRSRFENTGLGAAPQETDPQPEAARPWNNQSSPVTPRRKLTADRPAPGHRCLACLHLQASWTEPGHASPADSREIRDPWPPALSISARIGRSVLPGILFISGRSTLRPMRALGFLSEMLLAQQGVDTPRSFPDGRGHRSRINLPPAGCNPVHRDRRVIRVPHPNYRSVRSLIQTLPRHRSK
jgi:hypothetical protein